MKPVSWDSFTWDDPNVYWGDPCYRLEPGDAGYVPPASAIPKKPRRKKRKYMASNPTPTRYDELIASGEDLCDGINQIGATIGMTHNTFALTRADLDALIAAEDVLKTTVAPESAAYSALRTADSNGKGFIARAVKVLSISLGNDWSAAWEATGLPDNTVGVPRTQDARFIALNGLKAYFTANPAKENAPLNVTAAIAGPLYTAISDARQAVGNALATAKDKLMLRDAALKKFRDRFRGAINELEQILEDDDPQWYDFGLNRPADPATPGVVSNVVASAIGAGRVLVQIDGARRANSFNYYRKIVGVDEEPVKVINTEGTQHTIEGLGAGQNVEVTVTGVNDAGEGQPSTPVSVVVS